MGRGILKAQLRDFDEIGGRADREIQPRRRGKYDLKYDYADAIKSGYAVFFFQHPSMLNFQQELKRKYNRSNAESGPDNIMDKTVNPGGRKTKLWAAEYIPIFS